MPDAGHHVDVGLLGVLLADLARDAVHAGLEVDVVRVGHDALVGKFLLLLRAGGHRAGGRRRRVAANQGRGVCAEDGQRERLDRGSGGLLQGIARLCLDESCACGGGKLGAGPQERAWHASTQHVESTVVLFRPSRDGERDSLKSAMLPPQMLESEREVKVVLVSIPHEVAPGEVQA